MALVSCGSLRASQLTEPSILPPAIGFIAGSVNSRRHGAPRAGSRLNQGAFAWVARVRQASHTAHAAHPILARPLRSPVRIPAVSPRRSESRTANLRAGLGPCAKRYSNTRMQSSLSGIATFREHSPSPQFNRARTSLETSGEGIRPHRRRPVLSLENRRTAVTVH